MKDKDLTTGIINVGTLLQNTKLCIPIYQRPYKWSVRNVSQLIDDVFLHKTKSAYRLGTIVIHDDGNAHNIVDGQQRTITLILIAQAIITDKTETIKNPELRKLLQSLKEKLVNPEFSNEVSINNIQQNFVEIRRQVAGFDEDLIAFLLNKCEFTQFVLNDISEAFQFFDSQNARGKDLEPHDLLKAFHLREFSKTDEAVKSATIETWESMKTEELAGLFGDYLYRIKGWSKGNHSRYFTKENTNLFKGINIEKVENFPYTALFRIAHFYIDQYNQSYERNIDFNHSKFPFQINQPIINGRRFFEMISHYKEVFDKRNQILTNNAAINDVAKEILKTIDNYEGQERIGDRYVRMLFDCALICYIDKFGFRDISKAIEKIFIWAYSVRLNYQSVYLASVDNYVVEEINLFKIINDAYQPNDILTVHLKQISKINSTKTKEIEAIFTKLRYYGN